MSDNLYKPFHLSGTFYTERGFYFFFMPIFVPYDHIVEDAEKKGYKVKNQSQNFMIESGRAFGFGWIGIEIEDPKNTDSNIITINGDYTAFTHSGSYKQMGESFKKIMQDYPNAKEFYSVFLNSPKNTPEANLKTMILFK